MRKYKQNKKMPGIYSLHFRHKREAEALSRWASQAELVRPVGGRSWFQEGRDSVSDLLGLQPGLGLPAGLLLKMAQWR